MLVTRAELDEVGAQDRASCNSNMFCVELRGPVMAPPIGLYPLTLKNGGPCPSELDDTYPKPSALGGVWFRR